MPSKLTYLRVDKFRHVKPGSVVRFGGQINAVVGRNGAGKTTLLGLVSALVRNNFHEFARDEFEIGFRLEDGEFALEGTLSNKIGPNGGDAKIEFSGEFHHGDAVVHIESDANKSIVTDRGARLTRRSIVPKIDAQASSLGLINEARLVLALVDDAPSELSADVQSDDFAVVSLLFPATC